MKASEFRAEDELELAPIISGSPLGNDALADQVAALTPGQRVEQAMATMLRECVYQFYFAKHVCLALPDAPEAQNDGLSTATSWLKVTLLKQAVIGIGATVDLTFDRTSSYWQAVLSVEAALTKGPDLSPSGEAAVALLGELRGMTNPAKVRSFEYVRHLRNKWAGHASLDLVFDSWAAADQYVYWGHLEDAVVRMVNAFQDLGTLASMSSELSGIERAWHTEGLEPKVFRMTLAWQGAANLAEVMRFLAQRDAGTLVAALVSPQK